MVGVVFFIGSLHGSCFFSNRGNSWLKDRKEISDIDIIRIDSFLNEHFLFNKYFYLRLLFLTIPKPLKQSTIFKKDDPFRSSA